MSDALAADTTAADTTAADTTAADRTAVDAAAADGQATRRQAAALAARTREELVAAMDAAASPAVKWLHFWGHTPKAGAAVGAWVLSQWWPCRFVVEGAEYRSAEHWMMAEKARLFGDEEARGAILAAPTAAEAKKLGRLVRGFDESRWNAGRFEIVVCGNVHKFGQDPALRDYLLDTGNRVLVEASPRDTVWGIGLGAGNDRATDPRRWRGENLLGFALMEARARLRAVGG